MAHELPALPYPTNALEPSIDTRTMEIHHGKHHNAYVTNLNNALAKYPDLQALPLESLIRDLSKVPEEIRGAVRNNGGGHWNHSFFWTLMKPQGGGQPSGALAADIAATFGSFDAFKDAFGKACVGRFGSGWGWLVVKADGKLAITSTPNQDNPLMNVADVQGAPILGLDVWEHAYYLNYQNRRPDYIAAWWNTIDWSKVEALYAAAKK